MTGTRYLTATIILLFFTVSFYFLSLRLISQLHFHKAKNHLQDGYYGLAVSRLEKAVEYQDDDFMTWNYLGRAYHGLGRLQMAEQSLLVAEKARQAYITAARLNPHDAEAAFGVAREEARLERLYSRLHPGKQETRYDAFPYFEAAIRLRPNSIGYHYAAARYLHQQGRSQALLPVVTSLARIYPSAYNHLKKEAFWSPEVKEAVKEGLQQAIQEENEVRNTHIILSALLADEEDWDGAISHYEKATDDQDGAENPGNYSSLGRLYLQNGQLEEAEQSFLKALSMSDNREKDLERLYGVYKTGGCAGQFFPFYERARTAFPISAQTDIVLARSFIDLGQHAQAWQILSDLTQKNPDAQAYYWLYRIAKEQKDWDQMELSIQKAAMLEPRNSQYHLLFSQVLRQLKKLDSAEQEAGLAIEHAPRPSVGLFNHRASIRWDKKDYQGALRDWESGLSLQAGNAALHVRIAEAYINLGQREEARQHYQKALQLSPTNKTYQVKLEALETQY